MHTKKRITASELKYQYQANNPNGHFFDHKAMKFFGDTMSNYYVPVKTQLIEDCMGNIFQCYELQRKKPVKHGLCKSAWFTVDGFKQIHPADQ